MIITQFKSENIGRHPSLSFATPSPVIGLLGPNGVGKSTVLEMLKYAFTGETEDSIDTYVRYGEGNAYVEVEFVKNGKKGTIYRRFGKSPKRKLSWDGKEYTRASEVDAIMTEVFAADKKAIANAVFVRQGMLESILFSGEADRRSMFIKLVNMSFCAKRANTVLRKIQKLEATITDIGPAIQALSTQRETAAIALQQVNQELITLKDYSEEVAFCEDFMKAEDLLKRTTATIGAAENEQAAYVLERDRLFGVLQVEDQQKADMKYRQLRAVVQLASSSITGYDQGHMALFHYDRCTREIGETRGRLESDLAEIKKLNPEGLTAEMIADKLKAANQQAALYPWRRQAIESKDNWAQYKLRAEQAIQNYTKPEFTEEELKNLNAEWQKLGGQIDMVTTLLNTQSKIANCLAGQLEATTAKCPDCGLQIANPQDLKPEKLQQWQDQLKQLKADWQTCHDKCVRGNAAYKAYREFMVAKATEIDKANEEIQKIDHQLTVNVPRMSEEEAGIVAAQATTQKERLPILAKNTQQYARDISAKMKERDGYQAEGYVQRREHFTTIEGDRLREAQAKAVKDWEEAQEPFAQLGQTLTLLDATKNRITELKLQQSDLERKLEAPMLTSVIDLAVKLNGNMEAMKAEFKSRNDVRQQAVGRQEQASKNYDQINTEYQDLHRRAALDIGKRKLINDLQVLRKLLEDDGLPIAVVNYHFSRLAALTQEALSKLDANFAIMVDNDHPLSFKFIRLDEPVQYEMPMTKLSGGQKVRLCVAFLMAVQKRLVNEVGLLVLDEPSVHVDPAGVESLAEFLQSLQTQFQNTEMQVWVSDHHPALENCFSSVIRLT